MKKFLACTLCFILLLSLSGCSDYDRAVSSYKSGNYEKALERFEKLGDTGYMNKCRFMLLYEYILEKGEAAEEGNYTIYSSCISDFAYVFLYANPKNKGQIQVDFTISEPTSESESNYEVFLTLSVDDPNSAYQITQSTQDSDGGLTLITCDGTVDVSTYSTGMELDYTQCQRTTISEDDSNTSDKVNRTTRKVLFSYFGVAIDGLYETLNELNMGTTTKDLGFATWKYVTTQ